MTDRTGQVDPGGAQDVCPRARMTGALNRRDVLGAAALLAVGCRTSSRSLGSPASWVWSGGVTASTAKVVAKCPGAADATLRWDGRNVAPAAKTKDGVFRFEVDGLEPDRRYGYVIDSVSGDALTGSLRTFPRETPTSFSFVAGSCANTGSEHPVFNTMAKHDPRVFLHLGDLHYEDIGGDDMDRFRGAYDVVLSSSTQSNLYRRVPVAYVWDDHDFGRNNSDRTSASKRAANAAYREHVPSHRLPLSTAVYHAFSIGRVRFLMTDCRSQRTPPNTPHRYRTMLGSKQKAWLKRELLEAKGRYPLVVWISPVGWIGKELDGDSWPGFPAERAELAIFLADHGITNVLMLSGDAHMLAIDDGSNNGYAPGGRGRFPVFHVAALDQGGSDKGGPYSHDVQIGGGQFGLITVHDRVHELTVELSGRNADDKELIHHSFNVPG